MFANMIRMRRIHMMAICLVGISVELGTAMPIDGQAGKICRDELTPLMKMPPAERKLSDAQTAKLIGMADSGSLDVQKCVCLGLAFAEDANSIEVLRKLSKSQFKEVQATANYALKVRQNAGRKAHEMLRNLCFWLGRSDNGLERMFLANRMWVDFGEESAGTILLALKAESEVLLNGGQVSYAKRFGINAVRCDLLYYLSESTNKEVLAESLQVKWDETIDWGLAENVAYIMGSITPGRSRSYRESSRMELVDKIRAKLGEGK
jgi:hypothetical protein